MKSGAFLSDCVKVWRANGRLPSHPTQFAALLFSHDSQDVRPIYRLVLHSQSLAWEEKQIRATGRAASICRATTIRVAVCSALPADSRSRAPQSRSTNFGLCLEAETTPYPGRLVRSRVMSQCTRLMPLKYTSLFHVRAPSLYKWTSCEESIFQPFNILYHDAVFVRPSRVHVRQLDQQQTVEPTPLQCCEHGPHIQ